MANGRFDPSELRDSEGSAPTDAELGTALGVARHLEAHRGGSDIRPSAGFSDRVMAAVSREPAPRSAAWPGRGVPLSIAAVVAGLRNAWDLAFGGQGRPMALRAAGLAYVLVFAFGATAIAGSAAVGVAGALGMFDAGPSSTPVLPGPSELTSPSPADPSASPGEPSPSTDEPSTSLEPSPLASPSGEPGETEHPEQSERPSAEPSASPEGTVDPTETPEAPSASPSEEPSPSDDHGGGSPDPSETPKPSSGGSGSG
jgi:hypothetical protein